MDYAIVKLIDVDNIEGSCSYCEMADEFLPDYCNSMVRGWIGGQTFQSSGLIVSAKQWVKFTGVNGEATADISIAVTAEFPQEDTG